MNICDVYIYIGSMRVYRCERELLLFLLSIGIIVHQFCVEHAPELRNESCITLPFARENSYIYESVS